MKTTPIILLISLLALLAMAGCGSYWADQGAASRTSAEARLRQADAARQSAQAAIIDAEARGALAQSQAQALTAAMNQNSRLTRDIVDLVDNSEFVWLLGGVAVLALLVAAAAWRRPLAPPITPPRLVQVAQIETVAGRIELIQQPDESPAQFVSRLQAVAIQAAAAEQKLLLTDGGRGKKQQE